MEDDRRRAFAEQMISTLTGGAMSMLVSVGYRTGLFDAAARGPGTSVDLAGRAGLQERYVREWLGAMVTGGFFSYDPASGQYALPAEHAAFLTGDTAANVAPMASMLHHGRREVLQPPGEQRRPPARPAVLRDQPDVLHDRVPRRWRCRTRSDVGHRDGRPDARRGWIRPCRDAGFPPPAELHLRLPCLRSRRAAARDRRGRRRPG